MKTFNITKLATMFFLGMSIISCSSNNETLEEMDTTPSINLEKNTVASTNAVGSLNYYTIADTGTYFQFSISEKSPNLQNPGFGVKVDLMLKELPSQSTTLNHRSEANFNLVTGEYFLNTADFKTEKWHIPFINSRPTTALKVTIENDIATFTIEQVEMSDNFVAPITKTDKINISFSIPVGELNANSNVFRALAK